jgi:tetratricopeptide (TPR) repeat protein
MPSGDDRAGLSTRAAAARSTACAAQVTRSFGNTQGVPGDDVMDKAFKAEFRLLTQLHHPNLAAVYDFGRCDGDVVYFTQELLSGQSLAEFLRGAPRETVVEIFVQLARALDYIHALGFVHEDIKPSNVIVCQPETDGSQPQAKLIDFGLARLFRAAATPPPASSTTPRSTRCSAPPASPPRRRSRASRPTRAPTSTRSPPRSTRPSAAVRPFPSRTFKEALRNQLDWRPELAGALLQPLRPRRRRAGRPHAQPDPNLRPQSARSIVLELLRRESVHIRDRQKTAQDRREFARVLVEHLPFVDRADYLDILLRPRLRGAPLRRTAAPTSAAGHLIRTVLVEAPEGMGKARLLSEMRREVQLGDGLFVEGNCWTSDGDGLGPFAPVVLQLATALGDRSPTVRQYHELVRAARERNHETAAAGPAARVPDPLQRASTPTCCYLSDLARGSELTRALVDQLARAIDHNEARDPAVRQHRAAAQAAPRARRLRRDHDRRAVQPAPVPAQGDARGPARHPRRGPGAQGPGDDARQAHRRPPAELPRDPARADRGVDPRPRQRHLGAALGLRSPPSSCTRPWPSAPRPASTRLGVSAWEIVSILYLIEAPIDEEQLAALTDLRRERFRRTLDRLEGEGLILCSAISGKGQVALAHASVREAVRIRYDDSLSETRLDLAERIAELDSKEPSLVFLRARLLDDAAESLEAISELEKAVETLFAAAQPQLAAQVLERIILRLRKQGRVAGLPRLLKAQLNLVERAAGALNDPRREAAHFEAGILVAELLVTTARRRCSGSASSTATPLDGNVDAEVALHRLQQAAQAAKQARDRILELRIANRRAEILLGAGEIEQAVRCSKEAMEILEIPEAQDMHTCHIIGTRLRCLSLAGQLAEARRLHDIAKPLAARVSVLQRQSYISGIAYLAVLGNEPERAIPETRQAIEQLRAVNITRMLISPLHNIGDLLLRSGDLEAAADAFKEALRLAGLHGHTYQIHLNCGFLGYTLARMGKVEEGAAMLAEARRGFAADPKRAVRPAPAAPARRRGRAHARPEPARTPRARGDARRLPVDQRAVARAVGPGGPQPHRARPRHLVHRDPRGARVEPRLPPTKRPCAPKPLR